MRKRLSHYTIVLLAIVLSQLVYLALSDGHYGLFGLIFGLVAFDLGRKCLAAFQGRCFSISTLFASPFASCDDDVRSPAELQANLGRYDPYEFYGLGSPQANFIAHEKDSESHFLIE